MGVYLCSVGRRVVRGCWLRLCISNGTYGCRRCGSQEYHASMVLIVCLFLPCSAQIVVCCLKSVGLGEAECI
jgi:hypothetical protein